MILYNNIVKISKNRWIGYMLKVAFLLASSICGKGADQLATCNAAEFYIITCKQIFMPPTSKKLRGHIGLGQSVSQSVCQSVSL